MRGNIYFPLGQRIANTAAVHGVRHTAQWAKRRGVPLEQFLILAKGAGALRTAAPRQ